MLFRQIIHEDLGCASYLVADRESGVAVIVDPQWDVAPYRRLARLHGVKIGHVLETHNHADHVSGHGRLAGTTGATVHINALAEAEYAHEPFGDGWVLELGDLRIEAIHTPGHRPEHTCFLLSDASRGGTPWALLGGDSLFIGAVARPDLAVEPRQGAADMFRSLQQRLLPLDDEVEVWPGHLGGSLCAGGGIDLKTSSTIGFERRHNAAFAIADEARFVEDALAGLGDRPPNVEQIVSLNRGPWVESFGTPAALTPHEVEEAVARGAVVIDGRTNEEFDEAHIAGALSTSAYDTGFGTKVSRVAPAGAEIIVVAASDGDERDAAELLAAVGMRVRGFLVGGMTAWRTENRPVEKIELIDPNVLAERLRGPEPPVVLDVRNADEYAGEHIPDSLHIPYGDLAGRLDELPRERPIAAICRGGKRSGLAASILQREGFADVVHVGQGVGSWRDNGHPVESGSQTASPTLG
ncbi:MAG TPA: rhodanese-like domain-containing protein [Solirubrobacterales bacterium]|nr:rhodanese-like domain-containing protein [Solirubrobacterales bacterium]